MSYILEYGGHRSVSKHLKNVGWATNLNAGSRIEARGIELYEITVQLTVNGSYHVDEVITVIFEVIRLTNFDIEYNTINVFCIFRNNFF